VVDTADGLADLRNPGALTFTLPLLEVPIERARNSLSKLQAEAESNGVAPLAFPLTQLVILALSHGGFWADQALRWLPPIELGVNERSAVIDSLNSIESNTAFAQSLRHQARRHRRRLDA